MGSCSPDSRLKSADFDGLPSKLLKRGCNHAPDLLLYELDGRQIVVKDFRSKSGMWRTLVGRLLTSREARVLHAVEGMRGVPQFRGKLGPYRVAMTYIAGTVPTRKDPAFKNREAFISELAQLVSALHRRGVVHLDLKHRSNVVTTVDGHPVILDFASGLCFNPNWFGGRLAVKLFGAADRLAVVKWKRRLCPELLSEAEQRRLSRVRRFEVWLPNSLIKGVLRLLRRET